VSLAPAVAAIRRGGVVAYPTEAVYGLGCDPRAALAVERILAMKGRPRNLGLILIASEFVQLAPYLESLPAELEKRAGETWPGPVTWVWPARADVPAWLTGGRDTLAVRVTAHPVAARLCHEAGMAIVSTSANPHGRPPARTPEEVEAYFGKQVSAVVDAPLGDAERPTEIRDVRTGEVLRAG
jgi:L-threonylcarbamoyladenylate synthase